VGTNVLDEHDASISTVEVSQDGKVDGYTEETRNKLDHAPLPTN
jgi:hypothetical protein